MECNNCKSKGVEVLYRLKDYDVLECRKCHLRFSCPPLKHIYEKDYFTGEHKKYFSSCKKGYDENDLKIKNFKQGLQEIEKFAKKGRIFDLGCATGVFLDICKKNKWKSYGMDISKYATSYAKKTFKVHTDAGEITKTKNKKEFFDVVTMWDFIEHVNNPFETLAELKKMLKRGGILFISTINEESLMNSIANFLYKISLGTIKKPVELLHPPQHLTHFSKKTLNSMLKRLSFKIIYTQKLEVPIENFEGGFFKKKIIQVFYFFQKMLHREYMLWVIAKK